VFDDRKKVQLKTNVTNNNAHYVVEVLTAVNMNTGIFWDVMPYTNSPAC
jgi:hypothetical protein